MPADLAAPVKLFMVVALAFCHMFVVPYTWGVRLCGQYQDAIKTRNSAKSGENTWLSKPITRRTLKLHVQHHSQDANWLCYETLFQLGHTFLYLCFQNIFLEALKIVHWLLHFSAFWNDSIATTFLQWRVGHYHITMLASCFWKFQSSISQNERENCITFTLLLAIYRQQKRKYVPPSSSL